MPDLTSDSRTHRPEPASAVRVRRPVLADGAAMWRLARDSGTLDLNSSYAYLLWARDFAGSSVVAEAPDGEVVGFVSGYLRPDRPDVLLVWQVAVDAGHRGRGLARRMLDAVVGAQPGCARMETTVTADNEASIALFTSFAASRGAALERTPLFRAEDFPDGHDTEWLYAIGPFAR